MIESLFRMGERYSFETISGSVLPLNITNVKILSILNGGTAERLGYSVATKHAQIYPIASSENVFVQKDFLKQQYIEVEYENGQRDAFGEWWIRTDSITPITDTRYIAIFDQVTPELATALPAILAANGVKLLSLEPYTQKIG